MIEISRVNKFFSSLLDIDKIIEKPNNETGKIELIIEVQTKELIIDEIKKITDKKIRVNEATEMFLKWSLTKTINATTSIAIPIKKQIVELKPPLNKSKIIKPKATEKTQTNDCLLKLAKELFISK